MNNKPFSPCIPSQKLSNNTKVTGEKKTHLCLQCLINVAEWGNSVCYALLYTDNAFFICFSSMHCVTGITTTFPNRQMKEEQMFSRDWNRIVQAMDAFEKKTDR